MAYRVDLDDFLTVTDYHCPKKIELADCGLDDNAARKISTFMIRDTTVRRLNLQWNDIWPDGAQAIAQAMTNSPALEYLNLGHNDIKSKGAEYIANAVKRNKSLRFLGLCDNNIDDVGAMCILNALNENTTLHTLEIEGNPIQDRSLKEKIQERLRRNRTMQRTDSPPRPQYTEMIEANKTLTEALETQKAQNSNLLKRLDKTNSELNSTRARLNEHCKAHSSLEHQLEESIHERLNLERQVASLSKQLEKEKSKTGELKTTTNDASKVKERLEAENQRMNEQVRNMTAERRRLRDENESLSKQLALLSGTPSAYAGMDLAALAALEEQVDASLRAIRNFRMMSLQRKFEEMQETKRCKICFEGSVETVLIPCRHHILCKICSEKVTKCPICNQQINSRIFTFES